MHLRPDHAVRDLPTLHAFIKQYPLGVLTTSLPSERYQTLQCSHIPWVLDSETPLETNIRKEARERDNEAEIPPPHLSMGVLRGHIARQNPQSKAMVESADSSKPAPIPGAFPTESEEQLPSHTLPGEVLIVFTSPVDHYITPNFYTESKPATGRVAPTWNYAAVQVYGRATIHHDRTEQTEQFLRRQLSDLARLGEEGIMGFRAGSGSSSVKQGNGRGGDMSDLLEGQEVDRELDQGGTGGVGNGTASPMPASEPWRITDAPRDYISGLLGNIVGISVEITRIEGRFKVSQERPVGDRDGVVEGLSGMGGAAREMAELVRRGTGLAGK